MLPQPLQGLTIHTALLLGFVVIFGVWLVSGYSLMRRMSEVEDRASEMNARFTRSEELLFTVRTQILLSAIYRRDALLDTDPGDLEYYSEQLQATRKVIERALGEYVPVVTSSLERENWNRLLREIDDYWPTLQPEQIWNPARDPAEARSFLRQQVIPKRELIIRISEQIQTLNRAAFQDQQAELAEIHHGMRRRFLWTTAATVLFAALVALLVLRHAGQLEARISQQHQEDRQNKRDLQRLSARLVHAQEEERRGIARELHDEVGQALTAIKMDLSLAERKLRMPEQARQPIEEARAIADRTLRSVRDLSQLLHPAMLDDLGLPDTLNWYLRGFSQRTGIRADLVHEGMEERLPSGVEVCAYRVVQEALTNVARHSRASICHLRLRRSPESLQIVVEDDGRGFDPELLKAGEIQNGLGLMGIQERVSGLRGRFRLDSRPGKGTHLAVELPAAPVTSGDDPALEARAEDSGAAP
jgi:signal transduction histidine kinase